MKRARFWRTLAVLTLGFAVMACRSPTNQLPEPASISLNVATAHDFGTVQVGYTAIAPLEVTVSNTGGLATGELTVELSGDNPDSFTASYISPSSIPAGGIATFTVGPNHDLPVGTYTAIVTVSGETSQSFVVSFEVTEDTPDPTFGISLSAAATETFGPFQVGYPEITPRPITITNIGTQPTGELTVELSGDNPDFFSASAISPSDIPVGGTATFTVGPNHDLPVGTHTATVTVSGETSRSFTVSFQVTQDAPDPTFGINLNVAATHGFGTAQVGYSEITPLEVTISNIGNQPTGELTVALSGDGFTGFTLSATSIASIAVGGAATFTVGPNTGLPTGTHTATVMVSGVADITSRTFAVSFEVVGEGKGPGEPGPGEPGPGEPGPGEPGPGEPGPGEPGPGEPGPGEPGPGEPGPGEPGPGEPGPGEPGPGEPGPGEPDPTFGIILSAPALHTFTSAQYGYAAITPLTVTITNTGNQATGELAVDLAGYNPGSFALSLATIPSIAADGSATFTIGPNTGLPEGTHAATVTVSGGEGITSQSFNVSFTVMLIPPSYGDFTINFAGFTNPIPGNITGPDLNLRNNNATGEIRITGIPAGANVNWFFQNAPITTGTTLAGGTATLALNPALHSERIGTHTVTVEVLAGGRLYSRIITFQVMP